MYIYIKKQAYCRIKPKTLAIKYHQHTLTGLLEREIPNNLFQLLAKLDHHLQDLRMKIAQLSFVLLYM